MNEKKVETKTKYVPKPIQKRAVRIPKSKIEKPEDTKAFEAEKIKLKKVIKEIKKQDPEFEIRAKKIAHQAKLKAGEIEIKSKASKEELEAEKIRIRKQKHQSKLRR